MEVIIRYKKMTDEKLESVAEAMADLIIGHVQTKNGRKNRDKRDLKFTEKVQEKSDGTVQPV